MSKYFSVEQGYELDSNKLEFYFRYKEALVARGSEREVKTAIESMKRRLDRRIGTLHLTALVLLLGAMVAIITSNVPLQLTFIALALTAYILAYVTTNMSDELAVSEAEVGVLREKALYRSIIRR